MSRKIMIAQPGRRDESLRRLLQETDNLILHFWLAANNCIRRNPGTFLTHFLTKAGRSLHKQKKIARAIADAKVTKATVRTLEHELGSLADPASIRRLAPFGIGAEAVCKTRIDSARKAALKAAIEVVETIRVSVSSSQRSHRRMNAGWKAALAGKNEVNARKVKRGAEKLLSKLKAFAPSGAN
jgi:hypothetical protein